MESQPRPCQLIENDALVPDRGPPSREEPWSWYLGRRSRGLYKRIRASLAKAPRPVALEPAKAAWPAIELRPGDRVRVRSRDEIDRTLDASHTLRGCAFTPNMYAFCGREMVVKKRVERFFDERRWRMLRCHSMVLLEGAFCDASFDDTFRGCDRTCFLFFRTEWLERLS